METEPPQIETLYEVELQRLGQTVLYGGGDTTSGGLYTYGLAPFEPIDACAGAAIELTVGARNPSLTALTYGASGLPDGASFDADQQRFSWTPDPSQVGTHEVTFTVTDGVDAASAALTIRVCPGEVMDAGAPSSDGGLDAATAVDAGGEARDAGDPDAARDAGASLDAGEGAATDGGCGCRTAGAMPAGGGMPTGGALAALLVALSIRTRRRRSPASGRRARAHGAADGAKGPGRSAGAPRWSHGG